MATMQRVALRILALGTLLMFGAEGAQAFYASLDAKTVSNKKWKEATTDDQGRRVVEEKHRQIVDAKIHVFRNEGKSVKVQCYFFANHPTVKGPYLFDVQEQTVYGSGTVSFTSPDVTRSATRSQSFNFEGYLDPLGIRIPFEGTATDSTKSRGGRLYGWVVITVVDGVIGQVESNQSGLVREFESKALESRRTSILQSAPNIRSTRTIPPDATTAVLARELMFEFSLQDGTTERKTIPAGHAATILERDDSTCRIQIKDSLPLWVSYRDLREIAKKDAEPETSLATSYGRLLRDVKFGLTHGGRPVGETTVRAGTMVGIVETKGGKALVQHAGANPVWIDESLLAKD